MIRFDIAPAWHWSLVTVSLLAVFALIIWSYPRRLRDLSPGAARLLLLLRLAVAVVLAFTMLRPSLQLVEPDTRPRVIAVVMDRTKSMSIGDAAGGKTRREALIETIGTFRGQLEDLGENIEVRFFDFDTGLVPLELARDQLPARETTGDQTAMGNVLEKVLQESRNQQISGVVLMGDGAQRAVAPFNLDPRRVARMLGDQGLPVYTIPYGASGASDNAIDVSVDDLLVDRVVFANKAVIVRARVRLVGAANRDITVRLKVEDRTGKTIGQSGPMVQPPPTARTSPIRRITTTRNEDVRQVELSFVPSQPGEFKILVEVDGLVEEVRKTNNRRRSLISVRRGGIRVAYIDRPRPEIRSVQLLRASEKIQLETHIVRPGPDGRAAGLNAELFARDQHDVYILGNVPASVLGRDHLASLAARVREGAGLLMLGGFSAFGAGGYANTPLDALSPVAMSPAELQGSGDIETDLLPLCRDQGLGVLVYNPLAGGMLSGKYRIGESPRDNTRFTLGNAAGRYQQRYWDDVQLALVQTLQELADARSLSLVSVAVAWVLGRPGISSAIIGASRAEQLDASVGALDVEFDDELRSACDAIWWQVPRRPTVEGYR